MSETLLADEGWAGARRTQLAGDASGRRYERLDRDGDSAILMIAPRGSGAELRRFAALATHLRSLGLSAPEVFASRPDEGLMLLEDLGDSLYPAAISRDPGLEGELYDRAIDALLLLQSAPPPAGPTPFTPEEMARQACLAQATWAGLVADAPCPFEAPLREALEAVTPATPALMLRDFHAGNLFWLPDRPGPAAVGLIDFQDARLASPLYDIVSLLWDARRDVPNPLQARLLARTAERLGRPLASITAEAATLSLQRNLRILGVFAGLAARGRTGYLDHVPRVWRHIEEALAAPGHGHLASAIRDTLPPPSNEHLSRLQAPCDATPAP